RTRGSDDRKTRGAVRGKSAAAVPGARAQSPRLRLSRRSFLIGSAVAGAAALAGRAIAQRPQALSRATPVAITATPIDRFSVADPDRSRFGALFYRSGLELASRERGFGGFSALWRSPDGR